jgi:hypothetical protein
MKVYSIIIILPLLLASCVTKPVATPPSVSTAQVIESLTDAKEDLKEAGDQNTIVAQKIDRALTLAERLDALLEQIEKDTVASNKNVLKPN